jgi:hypothetical protein
MDSHKLAYLIIVPDNQTARLPPELHVLRRAANDGVLAYLIAAPHSRVAFDDGMRINIAVFANRHIIFDDHIRAYANITGYL